MSVMLTCTCVYAVAIVDQLEAGSRCFAQHCSCYKSEVKHFPLPPPSDNEYDLLQCLFQKVALGNEELGIFKMKKEMFPV